MADAATLTRPAQVTETIEGRAAELLTPEALAFLAELHRKFDARRLGAAGAAAERARSASTPTKARTSCPETKAVRSGDWRVVTPIPADLQDRRVEITGPTDRKARPSTPSTAGPRCS